MSRWAAYNDAAALHTVRMFRECLEPLLERIAPDQMLHHIKIVRHPDYPAVDETEVRLVLRPIGSVRDVSNALPQDKPLLATPKENTHDN